MTAHDAIRLLALRATPLSLDEVYAAVEDPHAGAIAFFVGTVRDHDEGRGVNGLEYSAHPSAEEQLRKVAEKVIAEYQVTALAAVHRTGKLRVGEAAVIVAASSPHRAEAFAACRRLIDDLKHTVPIWKHQRFTDGEAEWVASC